MVRLPLKKLKGDYGFDKAGARSQYGRAVTGPDLQPVLRYRHQNNWVLTFTTQKRYFNAPVTIVAESSRKWLGRVQAPWERAIMRDRARKSVLSLLHFGSTEVPLMEGSIFIYQQDSRSSVIMFPSRLFLNMGIFVSDYGSVV
jgi:hypothetical protein